MKPLNGGFRVAVYLWNQPDSVRALLTRGQLLHATTLAKLAEIVLIANNYERPYEVIYEPKNK